MMTQKTLFDCFHRPKRHPLVEDYSPPSNTFCERETMTQGKAHLVKEISSASSGYYSQSVEDNGEPSSQPLSTCELPNYPQIPVTSRTRHFYEICKTLHPLNDNQIRELGAALGLSHSKLEKMKNLPSDMIEAWLRKEDEVLDVCPDPLTWNCLVDKLDEIGQRGIAKNVREKYIVEGSTADGNRNVEENENVQGNNTLNSYHEDSQSNSRREAMVSKSFKSIASDAETQSGSPGSFPYLDVKTLTKKQKTMLEDKLANETKQIIKNFSSFQRSVFSSLNRLNVNLKQLTGYIISLGTKKTDVVPRPFVSDDAEKVKTASSIDDIYVILAEYTSFFNFELLEGIIQVFCPKDDSVTTEHTQYVKHFKQFCQRSVFEVPRDAYGEPGQAAEFGAKLTSSVAPPSLDEINAARRKIAEILDLEPHALRLLRVDDGCVKLTLAIPRFIFKEIFPLSKSQRDKLSKHCIEILSETQAKQRGSMQQSTEVLMETKPRTSSSVPTIMTTKVGGESLPISIQFSDADLSPADHCRLMDRFILVRYMLLIAITFSSLKDRVSPTAVAAAVLGIRTYVVETDHNIPLLQDHKKSLLDAKSISEIFNVLFPFSSFYNYNFIAIVIEKCGTQTDRDRLSDYSRSFEWYCQKRPNAIAVYGSVLETGHQRVHVAFTLSCKERNLLNPATIRDSHFLIAKILGVQQSTLFLCHVTDVSEGVVEHGYIIPRFVAEKILPLPERTKFSLYEEAKVLSYSHHLHEFMSFVNIDKFYSEQREPKIPDVVTPSPQYRSLRATTFISSRKKRKSSTSSQQADDTELPVKRPKLSTMSQFTKITVGSGKQVPWEDIDEMYVHDDESYDDIDGDTHDWTSSRIPSHLFTEDGYIKRLAPGNLKGNSTITAKTLPLGTGSKARKTFAKEKVLSKRTTLKEMPIKQEHVKGFSPTPMDEDSSLYDDLFDLTSSNLHYERGLKIKADEKQATYIQEPEEFLNYVASIKKRPAPPEYAEDQSDSCSTDDDFGSVFKIRPQSLYSSDLYTQLELFPQTSFLF